MYFQYGAAEIDYLSQKDKRLGEAIQKIGPIQREVDSDLFSAVVHHIIGQQISRYECKSNNHRKPVNSHVSL